MFLIFLENLIVGRGEIWTLYVLVRNARNLVQCWGGGTDDLSVLSKQSKDKNNYYQDIPQLQLPTPHEMHQIVVSKKTMLRLWK